MDETNTSGNSDTVSTTTDAPDAAPVPEPIPTEAVTPVAEPTPAAPPAIAPTAEVLPPSVQEITPASEPLPGGISPVASPALPDSTGRAQDTPQVVERVIERIVEKEVIKEVPVEKIVEVEKPVEKIVEKEVIKEVPVEKIVEVEKIVYKDTEVTDTKFHHMLANFLRSVGKKGRDFQHARALKKREAVLKLFDTHKEVTQKLVRDILKLRHSDANRVLTELRNENKIIMREPNRGSGQHGGRGTFYTKP